MSVTETLENVSPPPNWDEIERAHREERELRIMADLNRRTSAVASIRRISTEILDEAYTGDVYVLQQQQASLQSHFERFLAAHDALIAVADTRDVTAEHDRLWSEVEPLFNQAMAKLLRLCAPLLQPVPRSETDDSESTRSQQQQRPVVEGKLEPLAVAKFDGALHNWLAFKDSFETLIHNQDLPKRINLVDCVKQSVAKPRGLSAVHTVADIKKCGKH